ncbi:MAG: glycosyltransferase [Bacteroidetes bacterium]|nr:glycosyltransferase [Bacteroidota bacterium]
MPALKPETRNLKPSMLSILIPIFNFDVRPLVNDLHGQCEVVGIGYEILCFDDGSTTEFKLKNKEIWKLPNVIYREMPQNLGRSAIRNTLGKAARFEYLLFMDCDSKVVSSDFIKNYVDFTNVSLFPLKPSNSGALNQPPGVPNAVIYGGRCYAQASPTDHSLYFHWYYGRYREQTTAAERSRSPYHGFMTNNFLISKNTFLSILFDETLRQYGHEDTLFGLELMKRNVPIIHIDNPLEHVGLEPIDIFLRKTEQGIENLVKLERDGKKIDTKLIAVYGKLSHLKINWLIGVLFSMCKSMIVRQLSGSNPRLRLFDFYKLGYLESCMLNEKLD